MERMLVRFEKKDAMEDGTFSGYGATFGNIDLGGDVCVQGCFADSLKEWKSKGQLPAMYFAHDMRGGPIGDWLSMDEDNMGLPSTGKLWIDDMEKARQTRKMLTGTGPKGLSIGFITERAEEDPKTGARRLIKLNLLELSPVSFPMNPKAVILRAKSVLFEPDGSLISPRDAEHALRDVLGLSQSQAKAFMASGYQGLRRDGLSTEGVDDLLGSIRSLSASLKNH